MNLPEQLKSKNVAELEEWFLEGLEREPIPATDMMAVLREVHNAGATSQAYGWAELLQDTLAEREDRQHSLRLLELRLGWCGETQGFRKTCHEAAAKALSDRMGTAFVKAAGFDDRLPIGECLRRLNVLLCLCPGRLCHDKTWGFGVIKRLDDFYEKVTIDFRKKPGHQMSFAYASETLELIDENHLQSRRHRDEAALQVLVADDAAEIVRIALQSYGPLSADVLKEILVDGIVAANGWKDFWDRARKGLKRDPLVAMPAKRSEAIRLLSSERSYDEKWFEALAEERDPQVILDRALELGESGKKDELASESRDILRGRYRESFSEAKPIPPDEVLPYRVPMPHVNHTFLPGHRVMVQVQSTWFPLYDRNPQTFVKDVWRARPEDFVKATHRVHHARGGASFVELPVRPG